MKKLPDVSISSPSTRLIRAFGRSLQIPFLVAALAAGSAFADELADVNKALKAGQYPEALSKADAYLAKHPGDTPMRFIKGVILTEQGKSNEAIAIFTKLTEEHPEQPEPYNNLAVLYAANGQFDKARVALDAAIRTNPTYATAYENLGDVHARLASQAYDKALQLDSGNSNAKAKLTMLRSLASTRPNGPTAPVTPNTTPATPGTTPVTPATPPASQVASAKGAPATAASTTTTPAAASASKPAVAANTATPAATPPASKPTVVADAGKGSKDSKDSKPAHDSKPEAKVDEREEVMRVVHGWAKAWSNKDLKSYLNAYASDFQTPKGEPRKTWAEERRTRIEGKGHIEVRVESPVVVLNGSTATVKFRQVYKSDQLSADSRKTLVLEKQGAAWQIRQEHAGS